MSTNAATSIAAPGTRRTSSPFAPLKVRRTFEIIVELIKSRVFSGEYHPGDRLPAEREFARMLGVGRPAIREAYRALELIGIVEIRKGNKGGAFIAKRDHRTVTETLRDLIRLRQISMTDLTEARVVLEKDVAELALRRVGPEEVARLTACAEAAIRQSRAGITSTEENLRFHVLLGEMSGNPILAMMLTSTLDLLRLFIRAAAPKPEVSLDNAEEHRLIIDALQTGDFGRLWPILRDHILRSNGALMELARQSPLPGSIARAGERDDSNRWPGAVRSAPPNL